MLIIHILSNDQNDKGLSLEIEEVIAEYYPSTLLQNLTHFLKKDQPGYQGHSTARKCPTTGQDLIEFQNRVLRKSNGDNVSVPTVTLRHQTSSNSLNDFFIWCFKCAQERTVASPEHWLIQFGDRIRLRALLEVCKAFRLAALEKICWETLTRFGNGQNLGSHNLQVPGPQSASLSNTLPIPQIGPISLNFPLSQQNGVYFAPLIPWQYKPRRRPIQPQAQVRPPTTELYDRIGPSNTSRGEKRFRAINLATQQQGGTMRQVAPRTYLSVMRERAAQISDDEAEKSQTPEEQLAKSLRSETNAGQSNQNKRKREPATRGSFLIDDEESGEESARRRRYRPSDK